eukprot:625893-Prymnesium_polylepis.1
MQQLSGMGVGSRFGWLLAALCVLEGAVGGGSRGAAGTSLWGNLPQRGTSPWHLGAVVARLPCDETGVTAGERRCVSWRFRRPLRVAPTATVVPFLSSRPVSPFREGGSRAPGPRGSLF